MRNAQRVLLFVLIISGLLPRNKIFAQSSSTNEIKLNIGIILDLESDDHYAVISPFTQFLSASFRKSQHELSLGALMTQEANYSYEKPVFGGIFGYKYYLFKEPMRVNMYLNYSLEYFPYQYTLSDYDSLGRIIGTERHVAHVFNNALGFGFVVFFDKANRFSFYTTLCYAPSVEMEKHKKTYYFNYNWREAEVILGFSVKLASVK